MKSKLEVNDAPLKDIYGDFEKNDKLPYGDFLKKFNSFILVNKELLSKFSVKEFLNLEEIKKIISKEDIILNTLILLSGKDGDCQVIQNYINRYIDFVIDQKVIYHPDEYTGVNTKKTMFSHEPVQR